MDYEFLGFGLVIAASLMVGAAIASSRGNPFPPKLILLGVVLRIVGSVARYDMMRAFYGGISDASRYYGVGLALAHRLWDLDLSVLSFAYWFGGPDRWWGTPFMEKLSGLVLTFLGPTIRGEFLVFSMLAFFGLYWVALVVYRLRPGRGAVHFATWIFLWPSLWFWPGSVGKEAVSVFTIGLVTYGFAGRYGRIRWLPYLGGMALAFALRPHVAAVLALATAGAHWLQSWKRPSPRRLLEAAVAGGLALFVLAGMSRELGIDQPDLEGVEEYINQQSDFTLRGGSNLGNTPSGLAGIPQALVNIWARPFPWEAHNLMNLFASAEIMSLWWLAWRHRRGLKVVLKTWWKQRLLAFGVLLIFGYSVIIGLTFGNLGIIARQRTPMFPFVFLVLTGGGADLLRRRILPAARRQIPPASPGTPHQSSRPAAQRLPPQETTNSSGSGIWG